MDLQTTQASSPPTPTSNAPVASKDWKPEEIKENAVRAAREHLRPHSGIILRPGAASPPWVTPSSFPDSDLAFQWTGALKGHAFFAYSANHLIDTDHGVIVDVEATRVISTGRRLGRPGRWLEPTCDPVRCMKPGCESLTGDSAYGSADSLAWLAGSEEG